MSLSRPLDRLIELGLASRDVPFGEPARSSRRSLYRIADPFTRLWFRVVAPHRAELVSGAPRGRLAILDRHWSRLVSEAWEELCRHRLPWMAHPLLGEPGAWKPGGRWWLGNAPEWDIVAEDVAGTRVLLGEAKLASGGLRRLAADAARRSPPDLPARYRRYAIVRALFVPDTQRLTRVDDVAIVTMRHLAPR